MYEVQYKLYHFHTLSSRFITICQIQIQKSFSIFYLIVQSALLTGMKRDCEIALLQV